MSEEDTVCPNEAAEWKYYDRFNDTWVVWDIDDTFTIEDVDSNIVRCPDEAAAEKMLKRST